MSLSRRIAAGLMPDSVNTLCSASMAMVLREMLDLLDGGWGGQNWALAENL